MAAKSVVRSRDRLSSNGCNDQEALPTSGGAGHRAPARVYFAHLDHIELSTAFPFLDRSEVTYAESISHVDTRTTFIKSRALLRAVLARELGIAPARIRLRSGPYDKPELADDAADLHFNVSHSFGMALVAIHSRPTGVDVEHVDEHTDWVDVARELFSAAEQSQLSRADSAAERVRQFFRIWTKKEALLKAMGLGFAMEPRTLDVAEPGAFERFGWHLLPLPTAPAWEAALAIADPGADLRMVNVVSFSPFKVGRHSAI